MNYKKIGIILLVLMTLTCTFGAISAEDSVSFSSKSSSSSVQIVNNNLTMNGINFNIPDGYEEVEQESDSNSDDDDYDDEKKEDIDGTQVDNTVKSEFKNSNKEEIKIVIGEKSNNQKIESINPPNAEQKTINDKEGYLINDNGKAVFEYIQDGKIVKIEAVNEDVISQIIV